MFHAKYLGFSSLGSLGFLKEDFFKVFTICILGKSITPGAGPILTQGLLFEQTW
jgi:hypothetical protein